MTQCPSIYLPQGLDMAWLACVGRVEVEECVQEVDDVVAGRVFIGCDRTVLVELSVLHYSLQEFVHGSGLLQERQLYAVPVRPIYTPSNELTTLGGARSGGLPHARGDLASQQR